MELGAQTALHELTSHAKPISAREDISRVAAVSCQDEVLGAMIGEALHTVGLEGVVTVDDSQRCETTMEILEGIVFEQGFLSPDMATDERGTVAELRNPYILRGGPPMKSKESVWKEYVAQYMIGVPETLIENEMEYIMLDLRHRMQYDTLTGGRLHFNAGAELKEQEEKLRELAFNAVKSDLVMKAVLKEQGFTVTQEELEEEALAMAQRQNTTVEMVRRFFGDDLSGLERDIREKKAVSWVYEQYKQID